MKDAGGPRAAVLLIGNELLSGKIRDENGWYLAGRLRRLGVELVEVRMVSDAPADIAEAFNALSARAEILFTSGGVGPTHDDRTLEAIAQAVGRPLERSEELAELLRQHYGERCNEEVLRMADLVEGMTLRASAGWPVLRLDLPSAGSGAQRRVYVLPGIPQLLRSKVEALVELEGELPTGDRWTLETLELSGDESRISARLRALAAEHPEVEIGSYPRWEHDEQGRLRTLVRLTFESRQAELAQAARDAVAKALDIALPATTC